MNTDMITETIYFDDELTYKNYILDLICEGRLYEVLLHGLVENLDVILRKKYRRLDIEIEPGRWFVCLCSEYEERKIKSQEYKNNYQKKYYNEHKEQYHGYYKNKKK